MAFRKFLLTGGLVLIATLIIILPTANCTKYPINYNNLSEIVPLHYNVEIRFFFKDNILVGQCDIIIRTKRVLRSITLNSVPVYINKAILIDSKNITIESFSQSFKNTSENTFTFNLHRDVPPDTYILKVTYMRIIHRNFSSCAYQDKLGDKMLHQTGMEIMKARELFPCRDEPNINSIFKIAIKHDEEYAVFSNIPIRARNNAEDFMMWTNFEESLSMSARHIVVIITFTDFFFISSHFANVAINIWCRKNAVQQIYYARTVIGRLVYYFKQKQWLKRLELNIVVFWHPHDYNTTMEIVLLREADIIYNETLHPLIRKREIAHMIARQLALFVCEDALLWSKEGFVTFFGAFILDQIYKDDHMMDLMVVQAQQDSFRYDTPSTVNSSTLLNCTNISLNCTNISQIIVLEPLSNQMKSFIIWRMIYHIIPDVFWRGIRTYIDRHRIHLNVTPDDLWTIMQTLYNDTSSKHNQSKILNYHLKEIITNWITKNYYFVLNVKPNVKPYHLAFKNNTFLSWEISPIQSRYLSLNDKTDIWINVTYISKSSFDFNKTHHSLWLTTQSVLHIYSNFTDWIIVNIQQTGYYRVKYDFNNWQNLERYLNSKNTNYTKIHILNRAQIIDDAFYFFLQRELNYDFFWYLTKFVTQDANFVTWYPMIKVFESFACLYPLEYGEKVTRNMKIRINKLLTKIGYTEEPTDHTLTIYLRQEAVKWACMLNVPKCQKVAALELDKVLQNSVENSTLIGKKWIYCHGLRKANHTTWYEIWQRWNATSDENYLEYLTCSENYDIICIFLKITLSEKIQPNDSKRATRRANAFLVTVSKHAKTDQVNSCLFTILEEISFSRNRRNDIIATLIVIITHIDPTHYTTERITKFVSNYEYPIVKAVARKRRKRILEYRKLIQNYGYYFFSPT